MAYQSIFTTEEKTATAGGYRSVFGNTDINEGLQTKKSTLPKFLGGGSYTSIFGRPNTIAKTEAEYGLVPTKKGEEGHHIFPVSLGGLSEAYNFKALGEKDHAEITKVGNKALDDFNDGKLDLPEARLKVITKYQEILDRKEGIRQGVKANLLGGLGKVFTDIGSAFKKDYQKRDISEEQKAKDLAIRSLAGYEGKLFQDQEKKRLDEGKSLATYEEVADLTEANIDRTEKLAQGFTAPVRYTAGDLAKGLVSYSLEKKNSDLVYDPRSDTEKLLIGEGRVQRLLEQEDLYGMIARGVGIPATLVVMALIENPFMKEIGITIGIKKFIKDKMTKEAGELVIKLGSKELLKFTDDIIETSLKAGDITKVEAEIARGEILKMQVPKSVIKPTIPSIKEEPIFKEIKAKPTVKEPKQFDEFLSGKKRPPEVKVKPEIRKVTREQLPVGEGKVKVSRLEARTQSLLDNVTKDEIDSLGLSTYKSLNNKENIAKASEYVIKNPDEAMEVLKGNIQAPKGILNNSIFIAMDDVVKLEDNYDLARKFASLRSTRYGQEISVLREIDKDSPVRFIENLIDIREKAITKKLKGKTVSKVKQEIAKEIKIVKPNKYDWSSFVKSIEC